jgi:protein-S-isoprenylcysteine O-methyltransferase Ste14
MSKRKILPPTYFYMTLLLQIVFHFLIPLTQLISSPYNFCGILLIGIGIWLNIRADNLFKRNKTTVKPFEKPTALILEGPFTFTRHPMYLGMVIALLGLAIFWGSLIVFLFPVLFFILMHIAFIPQEEKDLEDTFGQRYLDYKKRVRRWL